MYLDPDKKSLFFYAQALTAMLYGLTPATVLLYLGFALLAALAV